MKKLLSINDIQDKPVDYIVDHFNKINWSENYVKFKAKKVNEILEKVLSRIHGTNLDDLSFDDLVKEIRVLLKTENNLLDAKEINCSKYSGRNGNNSYYKFRSESSLIFSNILYKTDTSKFSTIENLILKEITTHRSEGISLGNFNLPAYDVINDDTTALNEEHNLVNTFNYKKYSLEKEPVVEKYNNRYENSLKCINDFRKLKEHAGDEIIIWTQHKITRRLSKLGCNSVYWNISSYIKTWVEHLKKNNVDISAKISSIEKAELKYFKGEIVQEDLFKIFKRGTTVAAEKAIEDMTLETLTQLMDSDLKCVADRASRQISSIMNRVMQLLEGGTQSIKYLKKLMRSKTQDSEKIYHSIVKFLKLHNKIGYLNLDFFTNNALYVQAEDIISYFITLNRVPITITESQYEILNSKLTEDNKFIHPNLNAEITKRVSVEEKIKILSDPDIIFWSDAFESLFANVPWSILKDIIQNDRKEYFCNRAIDEKDYSFLKDVLSNEDSLNVAYFKPFSYKDKKDILFSLRTKSPNWAYPYIDDLKNIFTIPELELLLEEIISIERYERYSDQILSQINVVKAQEIILNSKEFHFNLTENLNIIKDNIEVTEHVLNRYSFPSIGYGYNASLVTSFLKEIESREYAEVLFGSFYNYNDEIIYLAHLLTEEEIIKNATHNANFFRQNLHLLPDNFLKQYKNNSELYDEVIGNKRLKVNRQFRNKLDERLSKIS